MPPRRRFQLESVPPPSREELLPVELNGRNYDLVFDQHCPVCRLGPEGVHVVNKMLTEGFTYRDISNHVFELSLPNGPHRLRTKTIQQHFEKHLPAKSAAVRTIIEHRATQMQQDFIEGTENLVSPYIYAEVLMQKAFYELAENKTPITPKEGMEAAKLLHQFRKEEAGSSDMAEALSQLNKIISAVRDVVPPQMFSEIIDKIQGNQIAATVDAEEDDEIALDDEETEYELEEPETGNEVS